MTTIIAVQGDGWCVIGWDSRISNVDDEGRSETHVLSDSQKKVVQNGPWLLGAAGDLRAINVLSHNFVPPVPRPTLSGSALDKFVSTDFVPALREVLEKSGYAPIQKEYPGKAEFESELIVAINGKAYSVDGDYSWITEASGLYAIGSGSAYAMGALSATGWGRSVLTARNSVLKALSVASKFDPSTGAPFHVAVQHAKERKKSSAKKRTTKKKSRR